MFCGMSPTPGVVEYAAAAIRPSAGPPTARPG